jgi:hypothetical protein
MNPISQLAHSLRLGEPRQYENLMIFPLSGNAISTVEYLTLDEALAARLLTITEVSESGRVPSLRLDNLAEQPVLLLDGEELIGAKQNRIVNLTILAPPRSSLEIPVSCTEAGRWSWRSHHFQSAGRTQFARARARKAAQVTESMLARGSRAANQHDMWDQIALKSRSLGVDSATGAMADVYLQMEERTARMVGELDRVLEDQIGAVFAIGGSVRGLEIFDKSQTYARQQAKLLRGYALDAIELPVKNGTEPERAQARALVTEVSNTGCLRSRAIGLGEDARFLSRTLDGGALIVDGNVIHLFALVRQSASAGETGYATGHVA